MEDIVREYCLRRQRAEHYLAASNNGNLMPELQLATAEITAWRNYVEQMVDPVTFAGFSSVPDPGRAPLSWNLNNNGYYTNFGRMEAQLHWLVNRDTAGKVTINVSGNNNQVAAGDGNTQTGGRDDQD